MVAPVLVTFAGAVGLTLHSTDVQAMRILHAPEFVVTAYTTSSTSYVPICRPHVEGAAVFFGGHADGKFTAIVFTAGAHTPRGVGIGSTRRAVRRAYPRAARDPNRYRDLYVVGPRTTVWRNPNIHPVLEFSFDGANRVDQLVLTTGQVVRSGGVGGERTYCR